MPCAGQILVVEDDDALRAALGDLFTRTCGSVLLARDGREALDLIEAGQVPCVIVTDMDMPRMDGGELVTALATRGLGHVPVVTMSGARFASGGVHLRKPFAWEELAQAVVGCAGDACSLRAVVNGETTLSGVG